MSSTALYGNEDARPAQKKLSTVKLAEVNGSNKVVPMNYDETRGQKLQRASAAKQGAVVGCLGSRGAQDAIGGYRDNDVTAALVNGKHNNPAVQRPANDARVVKASSKIAWAQPKGQALTFQ